MLTRLGLVVPGGSSSSMTHVPSFDRLSESVEVAEDSGFDSIWVADDPEQGSPGEEPGFEAYSLLGALALCTNAARLGALVTGVTTRPPALLAKQVTTLDLLSSGRAVLGVGAGLVDPHERHAGDPSASLSERYERLEEALKVFRAMFTKDPVRFEGRYYHLDDAVNRPHPLQDGGPPVLIGGNGETRTLKLVAYYAAACNLWGDIATIRRKIQVLESYCAATGRDPSSITKTVLVVLIIAKSESKAFERAEELSAQRHARRHLDKKKPPATFIAGDPAGVARQVANIRDLGIDGVIVSMPDIHEADSVGLAGDVLSNSL